MAIRRVYFIIDNKVRFNDFNIKWNGGFSIQQKQKNVEELHQMIIDTFHVSKESILEVSTKSNSKLGLSLSSFNLVVSHNGVSYPLESVYQSSKVFENMFGEYQVTDALFMNPKSAKVRLASENHSNLIKFRFFDTEFPLEPKYLFYDWLYIKAIKNIANLPERLKEYVYFTDIEFNPQKSLSCQSRTLVLFLWLISNKRLEEYIDNPLPFYRNLR